MSGAPGAPLVVNHWSLFAHPLYLEQVERLIEQVERLKQRDLDGYKKKNVTKRLAAIYKLSFESIPADPMHANYRLGDALGPENTHWFRAKFFQQYRLFFRFHSQSKILVYAWVNDDNTKRAYESDDDAYQVFKKGLARGQPPNDWNQLLTEARAETERLKRIAEQSAVTKSYSPTDEDSSASPE